MSFQCSNLSNYEKTRKKEHLKKILVLKYYKKIVNRQNCSLQYSVTYDNSYFHYLNFYLLKIRGFYQISEGVAKYLQGWQINFPGLWYVYTTNSLVRTCSTCSTFQSLIYIVMTTTCSIYHVLTGNIQYIFIFYNICTF